MRLGIAAVVIAGLGIAAASAAQPARLPFMEACASYILIEADTGLVVAEYEADTPRAPASMVKMMQMLMVAEGLDSRQWDLHEPIVVSAQAAAIGGSQVHLQTGEQTTLAALIGAVSVNSANDASMAVAEALWGSREAYLAASNARAQELGMIDTRIYSVHGLPPEPGTPYDRTTARDMAILAQWCARHPRVMDWVGMPAFQFRDTDTERSNTNRLLGRMPDCDGLKTGYTRAAGWCFAGTAQRDDIRLIVVVMGCDSVGERFDAAEALLEHGFHTVRRIRMLAAGSPLDTPILVRNSTTPRVHARTVAPLYALTTQDDRDRLEVVPVLNGRIAAPLPAGTEVGEVQVRVGEEVRGKAPLVITESLEPAGWRWKLQRAALGRPHETYAARGVAPSTSGTAQQGG